MQLVICGDWVAEVDAKQARDREAKNRGAATLAGLESGFRGSKSTMHDWDSFLAGADWREIGGGQALVEKPQLARHGRRKTSAHNPELDRGNAEFGTGFAPLVRWVPQSCRSLPLYAIPPKDGWCVD
jgi:hypothetical protein